MSVVAGSITCPECGATSYHPVDVAEGYCGRCRAWTSPPGGGCVFCGIVSGREPAERVAETRDSIAIRPRHPVTGGHTLVVPRVHVADAAEDPEVTASTMRDAALLGPGIAGGDFNLLTSVGAAATQTVFHLHVHIVPRRVGDGLTLPWTGQVKS